MYVHVHSVPLVPKQQVHAHTVWKPNWKVCAATWICLTFLNQLKCVPTCDVHVDMHHNGVPRRVIVDWSCFSGVARVEILLHIASL